MSNVVEVEEVRQRLAAQLEELHGFAEAQQGFDAGQQPSTAEERPFGVDIAETVNLNQVRERTHMRVRTRATVRYYVPLPIIGGNRIAAIDAGIADERAVLRQLLKRGEAWAFFLDVYYVASRRQVVPDSAWLAVEVDVDVAHTVSV